MATLPPVSAASLGLPAPYLGQVATGCILPTAFSSGNNQIYSRRGHYAWDKITSLQVGIPNWWVGAQNAPGNGTEASPGGVASVTATIEYPVGTFKRVTFGGSNTGSIPNGGTLLSDACAVTIPAGAKFYVRIWYSNTVGIPYITPNTPILGDQVNFGTTTPDLTGGGSTTAASTAVNFTACCIVAQTTRPSIFLSGDSRGAGIADTGDTSGDLGELARSVGRSYAYINAGIPSDRTSWAAANYAKRAALAAYCSHAICSYGINDFIQGSTSAAVNTSVGTLVGVLAAAVKSGMVDVATLAPVSTSSDSFVTTTNQTTAGSNAQRVAYNALVRSAQIAGMRRPVEIADAVESARDSGLWIPNYTSDGIHELYVACKAIANSGAFSPSAYSR